MKWHNTNYREQHLKEGKRILGKIQRNPGEDFWTAILNCRPRVVIGSRTLPSTAKALLESELKRRTT